MDGEKLRGLRESKGLTRRQVSIATGLTEVTIAEMEKNGNANPTLKTVTALAKFYKVPIDEIIGKEE